MFTLKVHPAAMSVTGGVQHAFDFLSGSWRTWLPVIAALAVVNMLAFVAIDDIAGDGLYYVDRWDGEIVWVPDAADRIWRIVPIAVLVGLATMVASWVFAGMAIAGLRGWKLTASVVLSRGLVALASSLIVGVVAFGGIVAVAVLVTLTGPLGMLVALVALAVAIYALVRIAFATLAIFEGFGPVAGLEESWRLSQGAVWRMIGWALMAGLISLGFSIMATIVSAPLAGTSPVSLALSQGVSGAVTSVASVVAIFMQAVLYESQRARHDPSLYPVAAYPAVMVPPAPYPYAYPAGVDYGPQGATDAAPREGGPPQA